jgi:hypothetical protein
LAKRIQNTFTAGMFGPKLLGRSDLQKWQSGAKDLKNVLVFKQGGLTRRPGTRFISEVRNSAHRTRLIPFVFNTQAAYALEFGDFYVRFYRNRTRLETSLIPTEIASPFATANVFDIQYTESADVLYTAHVSFTPYKLSRVSDTNWTLSQITFNPPPSLEADYVPNAELTLGATTGSSVTITANGTAFQAADVGRLIISGVGRGEVVGYTSPTELNINIIDDFSSVGPIGAGSWAIRLSPQTTLDFDKKEPVGAIVTGTAGTAAFKSIDVGKFIKGLGGTLRIISADTDTQITAEILSILKDSSTADPAAIPAGAWTLETEAWNVTAGWPSTVQLHQGRLWYARDQRVWGSQPDDYENFAEGASADDAIAFRITSNRVDIIQWLASNDQLFIGTAGGVHKVTGNQDGLLTPDEPIFVREVENIKCSDIPPLTAFHSLIFPQLARRELMQLKFVFEDDRERAAFLTDLNDTILNSGVIETAYQETPTPTLWLVLGNGQCATLTYHPNENVLAWTYHETDGFFESVCVIPSSDGDRDQVWFIVRRTINGATKRYVEVLEDNAEEFGNRGWQEFYVDSAYVFTASGGETFIPNLNHLEAKSVRYSVNGVDRGSATVSAGRITVAQLTAGDLVEIGLPYTHRIETLPAELPGGGATIRGIPKRWTRIGLVVRNSIIAYINGKPVNFVARGDPMGLPPPLFSGDKDLSNFGIDAEGTIVIEDDTPQPFSLLALYGDLDVGGH